jgi:hypothetical protein
MIVRQIRNDVLEEAINAAITERRDWLAGGKAADWPDYRNRVGQIEGLSAALQIVIGLAEESRPA